MGMVAIWKCVHTANIRRDIDSHSNLNTHRLFVVTLFIAMETVSMIDESLSQDVYRMGLPQWESNSLTSTAAGWGTLACVYTND